MARFVIAVMITLNNEIRVEPNSLVALTSLSPSCLSLPSAGRIASEDQDVSRPVLESPNGRKECALVAAKYILAVLASAFLTAALFRMSRGGGISHPQTKTWLLISAIFSAVSAWLWFRN